MGTANVRHQTGGGGRTAEEREREKEREKCIEKERVREREGVREREREKKKERCSRKTAQVDLGLAAGISVRIDVLV
jgi:hypothetical protein